MFLRIVLHGSLSFIFVWGPKYKGGNIFVYISKGACFSVDPWKRWVLCIDGINCTLCVMLMKRFLFIFVNDSGQWDIILLYT